MKASGSGAHENGVRVGTTGGGVNTAPPVLAISSPGGQTVRGVPLLPAAVPLPPTTPGAPPPAGAPPCGSFAAAIDPGPPPSTPDSSEPARHAHKRTHANSNGDPTLTVPRVLHMPLESRDAVDRHKAAAKQIRGATASILRAGGGSDVKTPREIAARAVCMGVMTFRSRFEGVRFAGDAAATQEAAEMIAGVTGWLFDAGLSPSLIKAEADLLKLKPNSWERPVLVAIGEAMVPESIGVLLAGLNLVSEIPPYDRAADAEPLLRMLPFLSDSPFVTRPGMPPREEWEAMATGVTPAAAAEIAGAESVAGLYWWRAVSESLVRAGKMPRARVAEILRDGEARARVLEIPYVKGDFKAFGKPYATLTADEHKAASMIAEARVRAFRWLLDDDVPWDAVPMDS